MNVRGVYQKLWEMHDDDEVRVTNGEMVALVLSVFKDKDRRIVWLEVEEDMSGND